MDVRAGTDGAVPGIEAVKVDETEVPSAEPEPIAVAIPPEDKEGAVAGTTSTINDDVRKQTSPFVSDTTIPSFLRSTYHFLPQHWRLERVLVTTLGAMAETNDGPFFNGRCNECG